MELKDRLDWVAKKWLLESFIEEEDLRWDDPWLQSIDLEYHKVDPDRSLYHDLVEDGMIRRVISDRMVEDSMRHAPPDTRALGRSLMMEQLAQDADPWGGVDCRIEWDGIKLANDEYINMSNPFTTYETVAAQLPEILARPRPPRPPQPEREGKRRRGDS